MHTPTPRIPLRTTATVVLAIASVAVLAFGAAPEQPAFGLHPAVDLRSSLETVMPTIQQLFTQLRALLDGGDATAEALGQLDAATLADIGIDRSEIHSIDAESHGLVSVTRRRILPTGLGHA
jgi:uncharacterized protein YjiS (DUF1127 family)